MNPHAAFLSDIADAPDDDAPRLVYADWLTEQGNPRGEFIRLQCGKQTDATVSRLYLLIQQHAEEWWPLQWRLRNRDMFPLGRVFEDAGRAIFCVGEVDQCLLLSRGFVYGVHCTQHWFLTNAGPLFAREPAIETVRLCDRESNVLWEERVSEPSVFRARYEWIFFYGRRSACADEIDYRLWGASLSQGVIDFYSADAAQAAISAWCIKFGRDAAAQLRKPSK